MPVYRIVAGLSCFLLSISTTLAAEHHKNHNNKDVVPAPGYSDLTYAIPDPETYNLPVLGPAADGNVIDTKGNTLHLQNLYGDKLVLLSFIYSSCNDVNGCPLATYVMSKVKEMVTRDRELAGKVKIITLSFDPRQDTPEVMKEYGSVFMSGDFEWHFLTTSGNSELTPILDKYNQYVLRETDESGQETGNISHILRVYLIDREKRIRNIYSTSFLHADILVSDLYSLIREGEFTGDMAVAGIYKELPGAGDYKEGYEHKNYKTRASSLKNRTGKHAKLDRYIKEPPLGLPMISVDRNNPITSAKIELGRQLFFDRRLSHNNTISCAMCHIPDQGFTSNEMSTAVGIEGKTVRRNSPTLYNVGYSEKLFHDGRETTLEQQIWGPLLAANEMGNPSVGRVINKIRAIPGYEQKFLQAFDGRNISMETIGMAIASYERVLVSGNSKFDRWYFKKEQSVFNRSEQRGFEVFSGKGHCTSCHTIGKDTALFTDNLLHNTGIGYFYSMAAANGKRKILVAPGLYIDVDDNAVKDASEPLPGDLGLYEITGDPDDRWKYKTPGLRNVALTAPYMHDGSLSTLKDVIRFYNNGGFGNELLDPLIKPLNLTEQEIDDLESFLHTLTGNNISEIVNDAFAVSVGNITR